jgi:hypothetical protein
VSIYDGHVRKHTKILMHLQQSQWDCLFTRNPKCHVACLVIFSCPSLKSHLLQQPPCHLCQEIQNIHAQLMSWQIHNKIRALFWRNLERPRRFALGSCAYSAHVVLKPHLERHWLGCLARERVAPIHWCVG